MAKLNTYVHVNGVAYGPDKDVPAEIAALISNPNVWEGNAPSNAGSEVKPQQSTLLQVVNAATAAPAVAATSGEGSGIPPKGGAGSGKDAWAVYAASKGVEVEDDATRDDIIAALDAADVPTE